MENQTNRKAWEVRQKNESVGHQTKNENVGYRLKLKVWETRANKNERMGGQTKKESLISQSKIEILGSQCQTKKI